MQKYVSESVKYTAVKGMKRDLHKKKTTINPSLFQSSSILFDSQFLHDIIFSL